MSPFETENTSPKYWPGLNKLGALLTELAQRSTEDASIKITDDDNKCANSTVRSNTITEEKEKQETPQKKVAAKGKDLKGEKDTKKNRINSQGKSGAQASLAQCQKKPRSSKSRESRTMLKSPANNRTPRAASVPDRQCDKGRQVDQDIREVFKRKNIDTSPGEEHKSLEPMRKRNNIS